ncbi:MAG: putative selenium-dependent hydroxylase accessory protein YqeC [Wenzhouxiangella sp.]|nr:MAG: putative selenium-dependent hydroxylase accessory protein YqeC [Wenzhouxiangella sp.]
MSELSEALGIGGGIVAAIGAGGKKSLLNAIAAETAGRLAWTATVFTARPPRWTGVEVHIGEEEELLSRARRQHGPGRHAFLRPSDKPARYAGLQPETVSRLHTAGRFDLTLVKADGARMRGLKCPRPGEPVLPPHTSTVLMVLSARVMGQPLDGEIVHRPERVGAVLGADPGTLIEPDHLATILTHPDGLLSGTTGLEVVPVINQVDNEECRELAELAARLALARSDRFDRVILTCLHRNATVASPVVARITR